MRKFIVFTAILICICTSVCAALPPATNLFYVADYADLLTDSTEQFIVSHSNALCTATQSQIVVATVNNMGGQNEREYGISLAREWQIGGKENNGVLILVALDERKINIEVGYGLEGALNDSKVGRYIDMYAMSYLQENDFDNGILNLYKVILNEVYKEYGLEVPENVAPVEYGNKEDDGDIGSIIITTLLLIFIIGSVFGSSKKGGGGNTGTGGSGGAFLGGYLLGGGMSHRGSGGGGFGGFRGGGGSFGGGGSSRGF